MRWRNLTLMLGSAVEVQCNNRRPPLGSPLDGAGTPWLMGPTAAFLATPWFLLLPESVRQADMRNRGDRILT